MLDIGSGSGILSIAALKLGAARAIGLEIEPDALSAARENAESNNVADQFEIAIRSVDEVKAGNFDIAQAQLVLANILAPILKKLLDAGMGDLIAPGGVLILSGDDPITFKMMSDPLIDAGGVVSVASNFVPKHKAEMVRLMKEGNQSEAEQLQSDLDPLFNIITVKTKETTPLGEVECRARNPLAAKTLMSILGMPSGGCRQPLGKMSQNGLETVLLNLVDN